MIEPGQQFRVESIEELKEAYKHLDFHFSLENEIDDFEKKGMRYVWRTSFDTIFLDNYEEDYEEIPNPFKQSKPKLKGIDRIMDDLSDEAKRLGFAVEVIFKNLDK